MKYSSAQAMILLLLRFGPTFDSEVFTRTLLFSASVVNLFR